MRWPAPLKVWPELKRPASRKEPQDIAPSHPCPPNPLPVYADQRNMFAQHTSPLPALRVIGVVQFMLPGAFPGPEMNVINLSFPMLLLRFATIDKNII